MDKMNLGTFKQAFPYTIPVMMGYIPIGMAFGILMSSHGYAYYWSILMGIFIYAGSMQFVAVGLLTSPINLTVAVFITFMVNARHLLYGLSLLEKFQGLGWRKLYLIFSLTDETYSLICGLQPPGNENAGNFYFCISLLNQLYWVFGCAVGGFLGSVIGFNIQGVDFAMTALFIVIFIEQWKSTDNHVSAITGVLLTFVCLLIFDKQNFLIPSMLGIIAVFAYIKYVGDGE